MAIQINVICKEMSKLGDECYSVSVFKRAFRDLLECLRDLPASEQSLALKYAHDYLRTFENDKRGENEADVSIGVEQKRSSRRKRAFPSKRIARDEIEDDFNEGLKTNDECPTTPVTANDELEDEDCFAADQSEKTNSYGFSSSNDVSSPLVRSVLSIKTTDETTYENTICEVARSSDFSKRYVCSVCREVFEDSLLMLEHLFRHEGSEQSCRMCKCTFFNHVAFKFHHKYDLCDLSNSICSKTFSVNGEDFDKFKRLQEESLTNIRICPFCGLEFSKNYNLKRHINKSCKREPDDVPTKKTSNYECKTCEIKFPKRASYRKHMKLFKDDEAHKHRKPGNFWCKDCTKDFCDQHYLKKHCSRKTHLLTVDKNRIINKSFVCEKCGISLLNDSDLKAHMSRTHKERALLLCSQCPYTTKLNENMLRHRYTCHEADNKKIICEQCPTAFKTTSALASHKKTVHSEIRKYQCDICFTSFKLNSQLNRHKTIHTNFFPFLCSYCPMGFRRKSHLQRHTHLKHEDHNAHHNPMVASVMNFNKTEKLTTNIAMPEITEEQVFSLMDVQSGELITLSASEMSKNSVINMTDTIQPGELITLAASDITKNTVISMTEADLLNGANMPYLWNNLTNTYQTYAEQPLEQAIYETFQ